MSLDDTNSQSEQEKQEREFLEKKSEKFLEAWKKAVILAGKEYFIITSESVDTATSRKQLMPNYERIDENGIRLMNEGCTQNSLLVLMCCFADPLNEHHQLDDLTIADFIWNLDGLDIDGRHIVAELVKYQ